MAGKFYAVKEGVCRGIFLTWEECKASVSGYSGAVYKSFKTRQEAEAFLGITSNGSASGENASGGKNSGGKNSGGNSSLSIGQVNVCKTEDCVKIYVDGSYNSATKEFSYGMVVLLEGKEETYSRKFDDESLAAMHNVAGEIKGAQAAMQYALDHQIPAIKIYHDYEGIAKWCLGLWKTNREGTRAYKEFYDRASKQIKIGFVKVAGHSNDKYNDMADELAKKALGLV